jgi:DNA-binding transcriptional ArsR family regulator
MLDDDPPKGVRTMSQDLTHAPRPRDLLSLKSAPIGTMLGALAEASTGAHDQEGVPPRAVQLADLIVAEVVRLIRLGTRTELTESAAAVSRAMIDASATRLTENYPEASRLFSAAAVALAAAVAPSSNGGEAAVLRSWNGKALQAVRLVAQSNDQSVARSELREALDITDESHLSHLLADLEAAGLIERSKQGRHVIVHLGPTAVVGPAADLIKNNGDDNAKVEQRIREILTAAIAGEILSADDIETEAELALDRLRERVRQFKREAAGADISVRRVVVGGTLAIVSVRVVGRLLGANAPLKVVDDEVLWSVVLDQGRIAEIVPWAECSDWLGRAVPVQEVVRSEPAVFMRSVIIRDIAEMGIGLDSSGELTYRSVMLDLLPKYARTEQQQATVRVARSDNANKITGSRGDVMQSARFADLEVLDDVQSLR